MKNKLSLSLIAVFLVGCLLPARAQDTAVKTNLLYDATATVNLGLEVGLAPKWTLDLSGNLKEADGHDDQAGEQDDEGQELDDGVLVDFLGHGDVPPV